MDPAAEITQWVHSVPIPDSPCMDARRLSCSPTLACSVSKVLDDDNLLIEIIVRLDFPTTLVRAALVCKRWLCHASDPAFLRRFRKLHPPRLLGFYLDVRSLSLFFNPTRPCFMPVLPQPPELATVACRVASHSFDSDSVRIEDCQNGRILVRRCTSRFGSYGDVLYPLGPKGAVAILPCPPENPPRDTRYSSHDYVLFKQGGQDLVLLGVV